MSRPTVYAPKVTRYYRRHRPVSIDGREVSALTTRYTFGAAKRRPAKGPRGGRAWQEYYRSVYWAGGMFWTVRNTYDASREGSPYQYLAVPITATLYDVHTSQTVEQGKALPVESITCDHGRPVQMVVNGQPIDCTAMSVSDFEALLDLA